MTQQLRFGLVAAALCLPSAGAGEPEPARVQTEAVTRTWRTADDELPADIVTAVIQTRDAFIWVGTSAGLVRFDGVKFTEVKPTQTSSSLQVTALCEDNFGRLWIGTQKGGLYQFAAGKMVSFTKRDGLLEDVITSLAADNKGSVWVGTKSGLNVWSGKEFRSFTVRNGLPDDLVTGIHVARSGTVWVTTRGGMCQFTNSHLAPFPLQAESQGRNPEYVGAYEDRRGNVWAFGDTYLINLTENRRLNYFRGSEATTVRFLCEGRDGRIWIGSGRGLVCFDGARFQPVNTFDVRAICEDGEGDLWLGTSGAGLVQMRSQALRIIKGDQGLPASPPTALALNAEGKVVVGTERGGVYLEEGDRFERLAGGEGVNDFVSSLCAGRDGSIWAGTLGGGLYAFRGGQNLQLTTADGLADNLVLSICADARGEIWAGTQAGTLHRFSATNRLRLDPILNSAITTIIPASGSGIWVGMGDGSVFGGEPGKFAPLLAGETFGSRPVLALYAGDQGRLWVGSAGGGLACVGRGLNRHWNVAKGLPSDVVAGIVEDSVKNLWLATATGVYRASREAVKQALTSDSALVCKLMSEAKTTCEPTAAFGGTRALVSPDDHLWFATSDGLLSVDSKQTGFDAAPPPVYLEKASVNGRPAFSLLRAGGWSEAASNTAPLTLHGHLLSLDVWFTAPSFSAPARLHVRHKLEGSDTDWVDDGATRFAHYGRLPYGPYRLRVAARQAGGPWQEAAASFAFDLPPPLYFRSWAIAIYSLAATGLVAGVVRMVSHRRLRRELALLEQQQSLERERMRIARDMHDDMGSKLTKISFLSERARAEAKPGGPLAGKIDRIAETSRELLQTMDEIVWVVNPRNDTLEQLTGYLGHYAMEYFQATSIACDLTLPQALPHHSVSSEARHNLFLAFEEALNNVLKHSGAATVKIEMLYHAPEFKILITDNGRGFQVPLVSAAADPLPNAATGRAGNGLKNMRQRLADVGGECSIRSPATNGAGTAVALRILLRDTNAIKL